MDISNIHTAVRSLTATRYGRVAIKLAPNKDQGADNLKSAIEKAMGAAVETEVIGESK